MGSNSFYRWGKRLNDLEIKARQFYRYGKLLHWSVNSGMIPLAIMRSSLNPLLKGNRIRNPITPSSAAISPPISLRPPPLC
jgi:hypothetical protein